jgi:hypothetical protein
MLVQVQNLLFRTSLIIPLLAFLSTRWRLPHLTPITYRRGAESAEFSCFSLCDLSVSAVKLTCR